MQAKETSEKIKPQDGRAMLEKDVAAFKERGAFSMPRTGAVRSSKALMLMIRSRPSYADLLDRRQSEQKKRGIPGFSQRLR